MYNNYLKRLLDILIGVIFLPFVFFAMIIIAIIVYVDDKGPVFYISPRIGKNGQIFMMYKFRTMRINSPDIRNIDGSTYNAENDFRLTKVGKKMRKMSIDEIPQVLNILKGEMSFVGPRPDLPEHYALYTEEEKRKLEVVPGVTGYNQAFFRNNVPWKSRIENDIFYIDHLTFLFDAKIVYQTIFTVLTRRNIFSCENANETIR